MVNRVKRNWRFFLGNNTEGTDLINRRLLLNMFEDSLAQKKKKKQNKTKQNLPPA